MQTQVTLAYTRTDIRLRADGTPYVLEVNPLPGFSPIASNFPLMTRVAGLSYAGFIRRIVELTMRRHRPRQPAGRRPAPLTEQEALR